METLELRWNSEKQSAEQSFAPVSSSVPSRWGMHRKLRYTYFYVALFSPYSSLYFTFAVSLCSILPLPTSNTQFRLPTQKSWKHSDRNQNRRKSRRTLCNKWKKKRFFSPRRFERAIRKRPNMVRCFAVKRALHGTRHPRKEKGAALQNKDWEACLHVRGDCATQPEKELRMNT